MTGGGKLQEVKVGRQCHRKVADPKVRINLSRGLRLVLTRNRRRLLAKGQKSRRRITKRRKRSISLRIEKSRRKTVQRTKSLRKGNNAVLHQALHQSQGVVDQAKAEESHENRIANMGKRREEGREYERR